MSSLIFLTAQDFAFVATDTLATFAEDGKPFKFCTKAFPLPHLRMIVSSTGVGGFGLNWFLQINENLVARDIQGVNRFTPEALRKLWREFNNLPGTPSGQMVTIYHFGFSLHDGSIHTYAYRSTNDFTSEELPYGIGTKPPIYDTERFEFPKDLKAMMDIQRANERSKPVHERVGIGGEIQVILLNKDGYSISTTDKFDDFESDERTIFSRDG